MDHIVLTTVIQQALIRVLDAALKQKGIELKSDVDLLLSSIQKQIDNKIEANVPEANPKA